MKEKKRKRKQTFRLIEHPLRDLCDGVAPRPQGEQSHLRRRQAPLQKEALLERTKLCPVGHQAKTWKVLMPPATSKQYLQMGGLVKESGSHSAQLSRAHSQRQLAESSRADPGTPRCGMGRSYRPGRQSSGSLHESHKLAGCIRAEQEQAARSWLTVLGQVTNMQWGSGRCEGKRGPPPGPSGLDTCVSTTLSFPFFFFDIYLFILDFKGLAM